METPGFQWFLTLIILLLCREGVGSCTGAEMRVTPSELVRLGSSIDVSCSVKLPNARCSEPAHLKIILDNSKLLVNEKVSGSGVTVRHHKVNSSESYFACKLQCAYGYEQLVCGVDVKAGLPPDKPRNLQCVQNERGAEAFCHWDPGQTTFLETAQSLWFSNGNGQNFSLSGAALVDVDDGTRLNVRGRWGASVPGGRLDTGSVYSVWVIASNRLASLASDTHQFTDIVRPRPPVITAVNCTDPEGTRLSWEPIPDSQTFQLRYHAHNHREWLTKEIHNRTQCEMGALKPFTNFTFQLRCCFSQRSWSDWSRKSICQTPEAAPTTQLDVWYTINRSEPHNPQLTVLWKPLGLEESRGKIRGYNVTLWEGSETRPAVTGHTTNTWYPAGAARAAWKLTVTGYNANGSSPPGSLSVHPSSDLPAPRKVFATWVGGGRMRVDWQEPMGWQSDGHGLYVVEWVTANSNSKVDWIKVNGSTNSVLIDNVPVKRCFRISVSAVSEAGVSPPAFILAYSDLQEGTPLSGPSLLPPKQGNEIQWREIPPEHHAGCLERYTVYLQDNLTSITVPRGPIEVSQRSYSIPDLKPGTYYVWMTASTRAGEGKGGARHWLDNNQDRASSDINLILKVFGVTLTFAGLLCVIYLCPLSRDKILSVFTKITSKLYIRDIPDPANCSWAKQYNSSKGKMEFPTLQSQTVYEDPETLHVEETLSGLELPFLSERTQAESDWRYRASGRQSQTHTCPLPLPQPRPPGPDTSQGDNVPLWSVKEQVPDYQRQLPRLYIRTGLSEERDSTSSSPTGHIVGYIPTNLTQVPDDLSEPGSGLPDCFPFVSLHSLSPTPFPWGGKLTLDVVKIDCGTLVD